MSTKHNKIHRESGDKSQIAAFRKAAKELGCEDNEERFKQALRTIAKQRSKSSAKKKS